MDALFRQQHGMSADSSGVVHHFSPISPPKFIKQYIVSLLLVFLPFAPTTQAQETVCARVKIEIKQKLTLERQAFDAEMRINNTTDSSLIENVSVAVKISEENGTPVAITDDPNNTSAKFFLRISNKSNISDVDGHGTVNPKTTSTINWLIIPAPGSSGASPFGKKFLIGATLRYRYAGEDQVLDVSPDVVTVKPLPLLTLDYFLPSDVYADDPLTAEIEPVEPFTLGLRVKNNGQAAARNLKIDSAQPKIVENSQGLLINFKLDGSYVDDAPAQNTLLLGFGDIAGGTSKTGRWIMETSLSGTFSDFTAKFSHADELGGAVTSLLQATNAHLILRDVRVDLPGRDTVRDFLAQDGDFLRVYESEGLDSLVTDRSAVAQLTPGASSNANAGFRLSMPVTAGFVYARLPDPFNGSKALGPVTRSDAKRILSENVWLSKTRNHDTKQWQYWISLFDVNSAGEYSTEFQAPAAAPRPPVIQAIADKSTQEEKQVSFLVEASSPDGKPVSLTAAPLPAGASFMPQAIDPKSPGVARAVFDWTPPKGTVGSYLIVYGASDGTLSASRSASIKVESAAPPPGPATPAIEVPVSGAQVESLTPSLSVQASASLKDPTTQLQFEIYADEALTQRVAAATVPKAAAAPGNGGGPVAQPTAWQPPAALSDNTRYWWRARAYDGNKLYSPWVNAQFFVNTVNDPPDSFNLTTPPPEAEVDSLTPTLAWTNSSDKDGDAITYSVFVYRDTALSDIAAQVDNLPPGEGGTTHWTPAAPLVNHAVYYWKVVARDALGAQTVTRARPLRVNTGNGAPSAPVILSPAVGGQSTAVNAVLTVRNSIDPENDPVSYLFEIDTVNTFDSAAKKTSGLVPQSAGGTTSWTSAPLTENQRYWWRVKAQDGRANSAWTVGDFMMNAANEAPPAPTVRNPGNGAWSATRQPSFEANPVVDPEHESLRYEFAIYRDKSLTQKVAEGSSPNTALIAPIRLADKTTYWWRVRAVDPHDAASPWSAPVVLYVSTGPYQPPSIAMTLPVKPTAPEVVTTPAGTRKQITLRWEGTDPNIDPVISLYYSNSRVGYQGTQIVDGLRQAAGTQSGTYLWDVSALAPGAYYVYALISDAKGVGRAYAPGAVVIPRASQYGLVYIKTTSSLHTSESGKTATFSVRLDAQAPIADVIMPIVSANPREGVPTQPALTFTPKNWSVPQTVTLIGRNDCAPDGSVAYQILTGPAISLDPDYIGVRGTVMTLLNDDDGDSRNTTNNPSLHICGMRVLSERQVGAKNWEYTLRAEMTNTGAAIRGASASLDLASPGKLQFVDRVLAFGAIGAGDTAKTADTIVVRSTMRIPKDVFEAKTSYRWTVKLQP